jgi:CHASE3 domain sensor protein
MRQQMTEMEDQEDDRVEQESKKTQQSIKKYAATTKINISLLKWVSIPEKKRFTRTH